MSAVPEISAGLYTEFSRRERDWDIVQLQKNLHSKCRKFTISVQEEGTAEVTGKIRVWVQILMHFHCNKCCTKKSALLMEDVGKEIWNIILDFLGCWEVGTLNFTVLLLRNWAAFRSKQNTLMAMVEMRSQNVKQSNQLGAEQVSSQSSRLKLKKFALSCKNFWKANCSNSQVKAVKKLQNPSLLINTIYLLRKAFFVLLESFIFHSLYLTLSQMFVVCVCAPVWSLNQLWVVTFLF